MTHAAIIKRLEKQLLAFLSNAHCPNIHLRHDAAEVEVFVRKARHTMDYMVFSTLDLANITIPEPLAGEGLSKKIMLLLATHCPYEYIYVENVLNPRYAEYWSRLARQGFAFEKRVADQPSYFITPKQIHTLMENLK